MYESTTRVGDSPIRPGTVTHVYYILDINAKPSSDRVETTGVGFPNTDIHGAQDDIEDRGLDTQPVERLGHESGERTVREMAEGVELAVIMSNSASQMGVPDTGVSKASSNAA